MGMSVREDIINWFADYVYYLNVYCTSDAYDREMLKAVLSILKEQERQPVIVCPHCGRRIK